MDKHGNINATEGCDRCPCGSKYWENDKCIDCGMMVEIAKIRQVADVHRYFSEVNLNIAVTTMVHYDLGWNDHIPAVGDLVDITTRHRQKGTIQ